MRTHRLSRSGMSRCALRHISCCAQACLAVRHTCVRSGISRCAQACLIFRSGMSYIARRQVSYCVHVALKHVSCCTQACFLQQSAPACLTLRSSVLHSWACLVLRSGMSRALRQLAGVALRHVSYCARACLAALHCAQACLILRSCCAQACLVFVQIFCAGFFTCCGRSKSSMILIKKQGGSQRVSCSAFGAPARVTTHMARTCVKSTGKHHRCKPCATNPSRQVSISA